MRTYAISELGPEAKERAIESIMNDSIFRDKDVDLDWRVEDLQDDLEERFGLRNVEISFSGFYSQGDGASFTGDVSDIPKFLESLGLLDKVYEKAIPYLEEAYSFGIRRISSRYVHENTVEFQIEEVDDTVIELMSPFGVGPIEMDLNKIIEGIELEDKAALWLKGECKRVYSELEKTYESEFSKEAAEEWAEGREMEFDEEGNEV